MDDTLQRKTQLRFASLCVSIKASYSLTRDTKSHESLPASVVSGAVFRFQLEALQPIIASGSGSRPFARFPPSHLRNAARIVSSQARLKSNCSAIVEDILLVSREPRIQLATDRQPT